MSKRMVRILTKSRFAPLNFGLIQSVGLNAACLFGVLAYKCPEIKSEFELEVTKIERMLGYSTFLRLKAEEKLIRHGLISKETKGMPPMNWYRIHFQKADDLLDGMVERVNKVHRLARQSSSTGSTKENTVTDDGIIGYGETVPVKNKSNNKSKNNIVEPPKDGDRKGTLLKDRAPEVRTPIDTAVAFASVQKALAAGGGTDGAPTIDLAGSSSSLAGGNGAGAGDGGGTATAPERKDAHEQNFIRYFVGEFEKVHSVKPIIDYKGGKATAMARKILKLMEGKERELGRIVTRYVQNIDPFYSQQGWPLGLLTSDSVLQKHSDIAYKQQKYADKIKGGVIDTSVSRGRRLDAV